MEALELKASVRQVTGRQVKQLRRAGWVPAILYGHNVEATPLQVEAKSLHKVLAQAGTHQLISLQVDNQKPVMTLARDIQRDVLKRHYLHVDFYAVTMTEKVRAEVPLILEGVAPAVKELGGVLTQGLDTVEIECLPGDLISAIPVNLEELVDFHHTITVADLKVPSSITILSDPESMVAKVEPPRKAEEIEVLEVEEVALKAEPEVLTEAREKAKEKAAEEEEEEE